MPSVTFPAPCSRSCRRAPKASVRPGSYCGEERRHAVGRDKWSRGESNPRPLECDVWTGVRRVLTGDEKGGGGQAFGRRGLTSFRQLSRRGTWGGGGAARGDGGRGGRGPERAG